MFLFLNVLCAKHSDMIIVQLDSEQLSCLIQNAVRKALDETQTNNTTHSEADKLLTIQEAAGIISLTVPTIYGLVSRSGIPCMKKGKRLYFSKKELSDWIKTGRKKTIAETNIEATAFINRKAK